MVKYIFVKQFESYTCRCTAFMKPQGITNLYSIFRVRIKITEKFWPTLISFQNVVSLHGETILATLASLAVILVVVNERKTIYMVI